MANYEKLNIPEKEEVFLSMLPPESVLRIRRKKQDKAGYQAILRELMVQVVLRREVEAAWDVTYRRQEKGAGHMACGKAFTYINATDGLADRDLSMAEEKADSDRGQLCPEVIRFIRGEHGKPALDPPCPDFDFNLSHSGSMVILCCAGCPVGVDIEKTRGRRLKIESMMRFFSEDERKRIRRAISPESEFYRIWTYREAFSKQTGMGLVLFGREDVEIDYERAMVFRGGEKLRIYEYFLPGYQIAVCAPESEGEPEIISMFPF